MHTIFGKFGDHWILCLIVAIVVQSFVLYQRSRGLLSYGNGRQYHPENIEITENSPLTGKTVVFLGSSVTRGFATKDISFVEMLAVKDGLHAVKAAENGTTLADVEVRTSLGKFSYLQRLKQLDPNMHVDVFVCQLSTNDATNMLELGEIAEGKDPDTFDTSTITGGIEAIVSYVQTTWNCPIVFYTSPLYGDELYAEMVHTLRLLSEKWDFHIVDLWNEPDIYENGRDVSCMNDQLHPTLKGYYSWIPYFEETLSDALTGKTPKRIAELNVSLENEVDPRVKLLKELIIRILTTFIILLFIF